MSKTTRIILLVMLSVIGYAEAILDDTARGTILDQYGNSIKFSPATGYIHRYRGSTKGIKGLQRYYDKRLKNGEDIITTINAELQENVESILDKAKAELNASEILVAVMQSHTGEIVALASSNRYDPSRITYQDIPRLNQNFSGRLFEPGSIMKPLVLSLALKNGYVTPDTVIDLHGGKLSISQKYTIADDTKSASISAAEVIAYSSNVGISLISWTLSGSELREGLQRFGLGIKSGIDLPRDEMGILKSATRLEHKLYKTNTSYGYGIAVTFMQMLKAYGVFANNGLIINPHIESNIINTPTRVLSQQTATKMKEILLMAVNRGTGYAAKINGLTIGGKTGTAHIAKNGKYTNTYNSSFFGFVEDGRADSYTIGVHVRNPKKLHFGSRTAAPLFGKVVRAMQHEGLLEKN